MDKCQEARTDPSLLPTANADVSIDQRVVDVTSQVKPTEEPPSRPRGPSFMSRSGSFTAKRQGNPEREKEKDGREKAEKMVQQLKSVRPNPA